MTPRTLLALTLSALLGTACTGKGEDGEDLDGDGFTAEEDCDDGDAAINPDAEDLCDGVDNNCDGLLDPSGNYFADRDGDGFGDLNSPIVACEPTDGVVANLDDCDDGDADVNPNAAETCNGIDDDCDRGTSEDGTVSFRAAGARTLTDLTSSFSAGSSRSPARDTLADDGVVTFCDGTYYASIEVAADVQLTSLGGRAILDGAGNSSILDITTDGLIVEVSDLTLRNGSGTGAAFAAFGFTEAGGGIHCAAESSLSLDTVTIQDSVGDVGGGIAIDGCTLSMTDSELSGNTAQLGAAAFLAYSASTITDSTVSTNQASSGGGGIYIFSGSLDLDGTLVSENTAIRGAGAYVDTSALSCTGDTAATEGFTGNVGDEGFGAVQLAGTGTTLRATDCDFGETGSGDDNSEYDISDIYRFVFGDDATFTCADGRCGTRHQVDIGARSNGRSLSGLYRGTPFTVSEDATIDRFAFDVSLDETCDVDFYVHIYDSSADTWSVLWSDSVSHSGGTDHPDSGDVGEVVYRGEVISLGWATTCEVFYYWSDYLSGTDLGIGVWPGVILQDHAYGGYDSSYTGFREIGVEYGYIYDMQVDYYTE